MPSEYTPSSEIKQMHSKMILSLLAVRNDIAWKKVYKRVCRRRPTAMSEYPSEQKALPLSRSREIGAKRKQTAVGVVLQVASLWQTAIMSHFSSDLHLLFLSSSPHLPYLPAFFHLPPRLKTFTAITLETIAPWRSACQNVSWCAGVARGRFYHNSSGAT